jgi:hypothetical protein
MGVPAEWKHEDRNRWEATTTEIQQKRRYFLKAHYEFLVEPHNRDL